MFEESRVYVFLEIDGEQVEVSDFVPVRALADAGQKEIIVFGRDGEERRIAFRDHATVRCIDIDAEQARREASVRHSVDNGEVNQ